MADTTQYFKTAASYLRRAALAKQQEITELRKLLDIRINEAYQKIQSLRDEMRLRETVAQNASRSANNPSPDLQRAEALRRVGELRSEISYREQDANQVRRHITDQITACEREIQAINQEANDLEAKT